MTDWLFAIGVTDLLLINLAVIILFATVIFGRRKSESYNMEEKWSIIDKNCKRRLSELDERIVKLQDLLTIADEKLLKLMDENVLAEENRLINMGNNISMNRNNYTQNKDLNELIKSEMNIEMNKHIKQLKFELFEGLRKEKEKAEEIIEEKYSEDEILQVSNIVEEESNKVFPEYVPTGPEHFNADMDDDDYMQNRYRNIFQLSESGLSSEEISHIVKMEISTINLILGISAAREKTNYSTL